MNIVGGIFFIVGGVFVFAGVLFAVGVVFVIVCDMFFGSAEFSWGISDA